MREQAPLKSKKLVASKLVGSKVLAPDATGVKRGVPASKTVFQKYDFDRSGTISKSEFQGLCYDMGVYLNDTELDLAVKVRLVLFLLP